MKQPMQPIALDERGVARFQANAIIRYVFDAGLLDLNAIAIMPFSDDDRMQIAQLLGYSVSGFGELSYADADVVARADAIVEKLLAPKGELDMASTVTINGVTITGGRNVTIRDNRVIVDGQDVTPDAKEISISVAGNVERLEADACTQITITGDVGSVTTQSGDVDVGGSIGGSVQTMSGDVDCGGSIVGSTTTMSGNIKHRR